MCDVGQRIKARRVSLGLSAEQLASDVGMSPATVYRYENGEIKKVNTNKLTLFAKALKTSEAYLMGWIDNVEEPENAPAQSTASMPANILPIMPESGQRIRILGEIAAGKPIFMEEDYETWVPAPMKADFALIVRGDSMLPTYMDGDVVYIREQPSVDDGQVAAVAVDDSATLKHVYRWMDGLNLVSDNPAYPPIYVDPSDQDVRVLGIVVGYTRMYANIDKLAGVTKGMSLK